MFKVAAQHRIGKYCCFIKLYKEFNTPVKIMHPSKNV